ncbi:5'/3'-nucleotidase sure family protein [Usnea florida]
MHLFTLFCALLPLTVKATNVVLSNDDGWAEINIRTFYNTLAAAGDSVVLSAPSENESGTGSSDTPATPLLKPCEFNSCPTGSPAEGNNASNTRLNYVNSYPVTSMRYGIQTLSPKFFGGAPDIAVAGYNVGANLGSTVLISGTVGAATEASKEGIPAIAFSGTTGSQTAYTAPLQTYMTVYADLSTNVTQSLVASGKPYLPSDIWLNVNFPAVSGSTCSSPADFSFVLSRINSASSGTPADVETCGSTRLPTETAVVGTTGCFASISVGNATNKADVTAAQQAVVLEKLQDILSCLP